MFTVVDKYISGGKTKQKQTKKDTKKINYKYGKLSVQIVNVTSIDKGLQDL